MVHKKKYIFVILIHLHIYIVIEFDLLMIKILEVYSLQKEEMKNHLKYLFYAADVLINKTKLFNFF